MGKQRTALFFLLLPLWLGAQRDSVPYCPMAIEQANWVIFDNSGFYSPIGFESSYVVRITGDSILDGIAYKKMWVANLPHDIGARPTELLPPYQVDTLHFYGLVRDNLGDRKFLGIIPTYDDPNNSAEVLIHDFGAEIGDTLHGAYKQDFLTLAGSDTMEVFGKRRRVQLTGRSGLLTIEGIGTSNTGPLCQNPVLALNEGYRAILHYCVGALGDCDLELLTSILPEDPQAATIVNVFPNPSVSRIVRVSGLTEQMAADFSLYDQMGRLRFRESGRRNFTLTLPNLPAGVYFLRTYQGTQTWTRKLILR